MNILKFNYQTIAHSKAKQDIAYQWEIFVCELEKLNISHKLNPERVDSIFFSRLCLKRCLSQNGVEILWRDLLNKDHKELKSFTHCALSISHTKQRSLAVLGINKEIETLGADIEHQERQISKKIQDYISNPRDIALTAIETWCLKEAAFKALSQNINHLSFSDIEILDGTIKAHQYQLSWKVMKQDSHILAICWK